MLSGLKAAAGLAAVIATLAVAVPAASASAKATPSSSVDPTVCQLLGSVTGSLGSARFAGGASLVNTLTNAGNSVGCPAPAPRASAPSPRASVLHAGP